MMNDNYKNCEKCNSNNIKVIKGFNNYFIPLLLIFIGIILYQISAFDIQNHLKRHLAVIIQILLFQSFIKISYFKKRYFIEGYYCKSCNYNSSDDIKKIKVSLSKFSLIYLVTFIIQMTINVIFVLKLIRI